MDWIRYVADRAGTRVTELNPVVTRRTDPDHLRDPDFHRSAFEYREERVLWSAARRLRGRLDDGMDRAPSPGASEPLRELSLLYALDRIEADRAWFLEAGYLDPPKSRAIRAKGSELCAELREGVVALVDAWGIPDEILEAPDGLRQPEPSA